MKIVILDGYTLKDKDISWEGFLNIGECKIYDRTPKKEVINRIEDAEIVIVNKIVMDKVVFDKCPNIKYIGALSTGYNQIDVIEAKKRGIVVTNVPTYGTKGVAQFTFSLILEFCNQVGIHNESVQKGEWISSKDFCYTKKDIIDIEGKTLGILGMGKIGSRVAEIGEAFGMEVIYYSNTTKNIDKYKWVELNKLFEQSDFLSLHCPLTAETAEIINWSNLTKMKPTSVIINTARGGLVNEYDLKKAIEKRVVLGACLDVVAVEPMKKDNPLLGIENIIITPHIAWASYESKNRLMKTAVNNLKSYLKGEIINNVT